MNRSVIAVVIVAAVALAETTADAAGPDRTTGRTFRLSKPSGPVFVMRVRWKAHFWREWVAPQTGHCRREGEQVEISTRIACVTISPPSWGALSGAHIRTGSPRFVRGKLERECAGLAPGVVLHRTRHVRWRGRRVIVDAKERITAAQAVERRLFGLGTARVRAYDVELPVAAKSRFPVPTYWLGRSFGGRRAARAVEHYASYGAGLPAENVYTMFYVRPREAAASSALPGSGSPPRSELQITSSPATAHLSRRTIAHFERAHRRYGWPRIPFTTADGDTAVLYPNLGEGKPFTNFTVRVGRTLVGVSAGRGLTQSEARTIATRLRRR